MPDQCSTCWFSRPFDEKPDVADHYTCRFNPPMPITRQEMGYHRTVWPVTCGDDWCGKFWADSNSAAPPSYIAIQSPTDFPIRIIENTPITITGIVDVDTSL